MLALPSVGPSLPKLTDRRPLGGTGLSVSPICLGIVGAPEIVPAAFDAGINFFFLTADLHWPLYENLRRGLEMLLARGGGVRDEIVVAVVSYLEEPLFGHLQFHEVLGEVTGLERVDVLVAGAVADAPTFNERYAHLRAARSVGRFSSRAIGASFHDRPTALAALNLDLLDVQYIRYNTGHPGARTDVFPFAKRDPRALVYNFTSTLGRVTAEALDRVGLDRRTTFLPPVTDYYRFALSNPCVNGLLCAPQEASQIESLAAALASGPLVPAQQEYMIRLSALTTPRYFV
jgi:aryl-alcohol dehydrogenase-like predicted oxidoreductase